MFINNTWLLLLGLLGLFTALRLFILFLTFIDISKFEVPVISKLSSFSSWLGANTAYQFGDVKQILFEFKVLGFAAASSIIKL